MAGLFQSGAVRMADMLVRLSVLAAIEPPSGAFVRRAMGYEKQKVLDWIKRFFSDQWAQECRMAFGGHPVGCHLAISRNTIVGFCCLDCTLRGFVGPIGVINDKRRRGFGKALILSALHDMRAFGYGYAVIGDVSSHVFFEKAVGAIVIPDAQESLYPPKIA